MTEMTVEALSVDLITSSNPEDWTLLLLHNTQLSAGPMNTSATESTAQ